MARKIERRSNRNLRVIVPHARNMDGAWICEYTQMTRELLRELRDAIEEYRQKNAQAGGGDTAANRDVAR